MNKLDTLFAKSSSPAPVEDALAHVSVDAVASLTTDMVNIPSPVGSEAELARYLEDRFRKVGMRAWTQEVEPGRHNVFGLIEGSGGGPRLLYAGHLDSAYKGDEEGIRELGPGYQPTANRDGDWIYGLGAFNMKGGHASSIVAVEALARAKVPLRGDLLIGGVVGETCHTQVDRYQGSRYRGCGIGARFMVANGLAADMTIVPEPTSGRISVASGGYIYFELATRAYPRATFRRGGMPFPATQDAIDKMLGALPRIREWGDDYLANTRYHGEEAGHVNVIAIEGGHPFRPTKRACACRLYLEVGTMPGQNNADIFNGLKACTEQLRADDPDLDIQLNVVQSSQGAEVSPDELVVQALSKAHESEWGVKPDINWDGWYADTSALIQAGIPSICYGPQGRARDGGSGDYPSSGEQVNVQDLYRGSHVFVRAALDICNRPRGKGRA